jgi:hypothetical protein
MRHTLKTAVRRLMLGSHFLRGFLPEDENPFAKFDKHVRIIELAAFSAIILVVGGIFLYNLLAGNIGICNSSAPPAWCK